MKFNEILTIESFDLKNVLPYTNLVPRQVIEYLTPIYNKLHPNFSSEQIAILLRKVGIKKGYLIKGDDDIMLYMIDKGDHIEYHFANISNQASEGITNTLGKSSINVFSTIVKIILDNLNKAKDIHILVEPNKYKLYKKIIESVIRQYGDGDWGVKKEEDNQHYKVIVLSPIKTHLSERFFEKE